MEFRPPPDIDINFWEKTGEYDYIGDIFYDYVCLTTKVPFIQNIYEYHCNRQIFAEFPWNFELQ